MSSAHSLTDLQEEINQLDPRYTLEKIIGSGSYGIVIRARDTSDNNALVAIKRVNKEIFEEVILAKRILREIKLLCHFHDDNIIGMRNVVTPKKEDFDYLYFVMDIMETDLKSVLRTQQKLTDAHIQFFVYQALRGLKVIHCAGVIHRDITPANILVNTNCDLKICDFGLAKEEADNGADMTDYVTMRWYRAPELVMEHRNYTTQIDVWGIGAILGELLGSKPLCQGKDRVNQLDKIVEQIGTPAEDEVNSIGSSAAQKYLKKKGFRPPVDLNQKYPNANPMALDLLRKMMAFHPDKRITVEEAMRHPYLADLYDDADEKISVPLFSFDESKMRTIADVKKAIFEESLKFHRDHPRSAPPSQTKSGSAGSGGAKTVVVPEDAVGRSGGGQSMNKQEVDQGRYEDSHE